MTDYKPGTIAKATVLGVPDMTVFRADYSWVSATLVGDRRAFWNDDVTDVRPLVVLDLSVGDVTPEQHARFLVEILRERAHTWLNLAADQIEAQTRPAIEEPKGLGAVVEDRDGDRWVRIYDAPAPWCWGASRYPWSEIKDAAVRVLSPGVES